MSPAQRLREILAAPGLQVMPGCYDGLSAKLVADAGVKVGFMSGFAVSATRLGMPDTGLISFAEMLDTLRNVSLGCNLAAQAPAEGTERSATRRRNGNLIAGERERNRQREVGVAHDHETSVARWVLRKAKHAVLDRIEKYTLSAFRAERDAAGGGGGVRVPRRARGRSSGGGPAAGCGVRGVQGLQAGVFGGPVPAGGASPAWAGG